MLESYWIQRLRKKDEKAFDVLYNSYKNLVFFIIVDIVKDRETAEELLQDTFMAMYQHIDSYHDDTNFKAWLMRIAKNKAINYYHQKNPAVTYDEAIIYEKLQKDDSVEDLYHDLRKILSYDEFTVLILSAVYDIKHKDIANYLGRPVGTVSWLYQEARKKAKEFLER